MLYSHTESRIINPLILVYSTDTVHCTPSSLVYKFPLYLSYSYSYIRTHPYPYVPTHTHTSTHKHASILGTLISPSPSYLYLPILIPTNHSSHRSRRCSAPLPSTPGPVVPQHPSSHVSYPVCPFPFRNVLVFFRTSLAKTSWETIYLSSTVLCASLGLSAFFK